MHWKRYFTALSSRNYRLYFGGQAISLLGTWMTTTASLWLVYQLSSSPYLLGLAGFASQAPAFFLAPIAGVWVDRVDRRRLLLGTQILSMCQSLALAAFALTHTIDIPHIIVLSLIQGVIDAIDMPLRQAMVLEFVERREHLPNAIALNSSILHLARMAGPAMAGLVIAEWGAGICFLIDGLSYLAVIGMLLTIRLAKRSVQKAGQHPWIEFQEGVRFAFGFAPVRALILFIAGIGATGFSYTVLAPVFARDVFHGDARMLGWLMSASGLGALCGAVYLSGRASARGLESVIVTGGAFMGCGLIGFALSRWPALSLGCLGLAGLGGVLMLASTNTLVQSLVDDDKRGRVLSIFITAFRSATPAGNLLAGALAAKLGAAAALAGGGVLCLLIVLAFYYNLPKFRAGSPIS